MRNPSLLLALILILTISCGKEKKSEDVIKQTQKPDLTMEEIPSESLPLLEGEYEAILRPINNQLSGFLPSGKGKLKITKNKFEIITFLDDDASVLHIQNIHDGTRCPNENDDINHDGLIDIKEILAVSGKILVPLDGKLESQESGINFYPIGKSFTYKSEANMELLLKDLYAYDQNPFDELKKLTAHEKFFVEGKIIIIHGTGKSAKIPSSVASYKDYAKHLSIPITCGKIFKKKSAPQIEDLYGPDT